MRASFKTTNAMAKEPFGGRMEPCMMATLSMASAMDMEFTSLQTGESTKAVGRMANTVALASASGPMEEVCLSQ